MTSPLPPPANPAQQPIKAETRDLLCALSALNHKVPEVGLAILDGRLSSGQQVAFAALLSELADLLREHAIRGDWRDQGSQVDHGLNGS